MINPYTSPTIPSDDEALRGSVPAPQWLHLLLWSVLSLIFVATYQRGLGASSPGDQLLRQVAQWGFAMTSAAAITGLYVLGTGARSKQVFRQPGHWMLLIAGGTSIVLVVFSLLLRSAGPLLGGLMTVVAFLFYLGAGWANRGVWRLMFLMGAGICIVDFFHLFSFPGPEPNVRYSFGTVAQPSLHLVMVVVACAKPRDHDWLHWLGVLIYIAGLAASVLGFASL